MVFKLKSCFGMDLRKGCIIIGSILLILEIVKLVKDSIDVYRFCQFAFTHIEFMDTQLKFYLVISVVSEVAQILGLLFATILFVGILKNRENNYTILFLELTAIVYVIDSFLFIYCLVKSINGPYPLNIVDTALIITEVVIKLLIPYYLLLILSYYSKEEGKLPLNESDLPPQYPVDNAKEKEEQLPKLENSKGDVELPESYLPRVNSGGRDCGLPDTYYPSLYEWNSKKDEPKTVHKLIV